MLKKFFIGFLLVYLFSCGLTYATPFDNLKSAAVPFDSSELTINVNIFTDDFTINALAFEIDYNNQWSRSYVMFQLEPSNWIDFFSNSTLSPIDFSDPTVLSENMDNYTTLTFNNSGGRQINCNFLKFDNLSETAIVPIPAAIYLFATGIFGLVGIRRKIS